MAINKGKVAIAGIAAGVVMGAIDVLMMKFVTGPGMTADMNNFKTGLGDSMNVPGAWMGTFGMDLFMGILLVWLYAAIRPRFGPGMQTAVYAAIYMWLIGCFFTLSYGMIGMMTWSHWTVMAIAWLVTLIISVGVGARLYTEDGASA